MGIVFEAPGSPKCRVSHCPVIGIFDSRWVQIFMVLTRTMHPTPRCRCQSGASLRAKRRLRMDVPTFNCLPPAMGLSPRRRSSDPASDGPGPMNTKTRTDNFPSSSCIGTQFAGAAMTRL